MNKNIYIYTHSHPSIPPFSSPVSCPPPFLLLPFSSSSPLFSLPHPLFIPHQVPSPSPFAPLWCATHATRPTASTMQRAPRRWL